MKIKNMMRPAMLAAIAALAISGPATAQGLGFVELGYGYNNAKNAEDNEDDSASSFTLSGAYRFTFGSANHVIIEGMVREDDYSNEVINRDIQTQTQVGLHYLRDFNLASGNNLMVGGFLGYANAPHSDNEDDYAVFFGGLEAIYNANEYFTFFGQIGLGDEISSSQDSAGFDNGRFYRAGMTYDTMRGTRITLEGEIGESDRYEDGDEPGYFTSIGLSGETDLTMISDSATLTYGVRTGTFDAFNDEDEVKETSLNIGVRWVFGPNKTKNLKRAGIIGLPYTPLRASVWTPALD